jgi:Cu/Ag efflux protein CusF
MRSIFVAAALALYATAAMAQPATQRLNGTIERVEGHNLSIKAESGDHFVVELADQTTVFAVSKVSLADIKPGAFIGVGAMPQADGSQRAIQVTVFPESQRGTGEGHRPWDARPNSTMTNGTVDTTVASVEGHVVMVKYKDGEKKIVIPDEASILAYSTADMSDLKPGAKVAFLRARKQGEGVYAADRVNVGRGDVALR